MTAPDIAILKKISEPQIKIHKEKIKNNALTISALLEPF